MDHCRGDRGSGNMDLLCHGMKFEGTIPRAAEKEKRGKKIREPKPEIYVRELKSKRSINIPAISR